MLILETERLIIRRFCNEDGEALYDYLSREEVVRFEPYEVMTLDECRVEAERRALHEAFWAVCLRDSGKLIGNLYFQQEEPGEFKTWELGYVFNPDHYGKGYATEASRRMLQYGFENLEAHRIIARCNPENKASWRLLERLGMLREGYFRKQAFFRRDEAGAPIWHDTYEYSMLELDFKSMTK